MIGLSIGRYAVEAKLGEGGMGVVYKARDTQLKRTVAIKVLPPAVVADADRKRRFVQEARAASALNHANIVTIHDIGSDEGRDFIVMEYLAGSTLDRRLPPTGLPAKQALQYGVAIADALAAAHQVGVIHRDLKPSNVLVTDDGRVKVLDFGLAKPLEPGPPLDTNRAREGHPPMPPQGSGAALSDDGRSEGGARRPGDRIGNHVAGAGAPPERMAQMGGVPRLPDDSFARVDSATDELFLVDDVP